MRPPRILVAGVGNVFFGDDGFGCEVARRLAARPLPEGVEVVDFGIRALDLVLSLLEGHDAVLLLDAMARDGTPGTLYVVEPDGAPSGQADLRALDAHRIGPEQALALPRAEGAPVGRVLVLGCEPAVFDPTGLSAVVAGAVDTAVELALGLLYDTLSAGPAAAA